MTVRCSGHCVNGLMTAQRRNEGGGVDNGRGVDDDVDSCTWRGAEYMRTDEITAEE